MQKLLTTYSLDAILITSDQNRFFYCDFAASRGYLFIQKDRRDLFVDMRYFEIAQNSLKDTNVILLKTMSQIKDYLEKYNIKKLGIEDEYLSLKQYSDFQKLWPKVKFVNIGGANLRIIKSPEAIERIDKAVSIALQALKNIRPLIKPGLTEKAVEIELIHQMKLLGAQKESFDAIVASGPRGSLPHGHASDKVIAKGEWITVDFGAYYQGYASDITRTFKVDDIDYQHEAKLKEIYQIVKEAQRLGIEAIKPGIPASEIDRICRDYITKKGYGEYFGHGTGHGLGIEVHEEPYVSANSNFILKENQVVTVEPGIYLPKVGGVRIEDDILVTADGYRILGDSEKIKYFK